VRAEFQLDSSTLRYQRKQPKDAAVRRIIATRTDDWKPKVLSFPWERIDL
jgi:hypothetical protein